VEFLRQKYPPSEPCGCETCRSFCKRPGWWTVEQADLAVKNRLSGRMMLEISPELTFGVISPAFYGNERKIAQNRYAGNGCNFLKKGLCELHGTAYMPLECSYCHHSRAGTGLQCHSDIEEAWNSIPGQRLVRRWCNIVESREGLEILNLIQKK